MDGGLSDPHAFGALARRLADFVEGGGRVIAVLDPPGSGALSLIDAVLIHLRQSPARVSNTLSSPLTLGRILFQLSPGDTVGDDDATLVRLLTEPAPDRGHKALVITHAGTLAPEALGALLRMAALPASALRLFLTGDEALRALLARPEAASHLREPGFAQVVSSASNAVRPAAASPQYPAAIGSARPPRLALALSAIIAALALATLTFVAIRPRSPTASPPDITEPPNPAPAAQAAPALPAPATPEPVAPGQPDRVPPSDQSAPDAAGPPPAIQPSVPPAQTLGSATEQTRHEFNAFLDRAGNDTAALTAAEREALFQQYLRWRQRQP